MAIIPSSNKQYVHMALMGVSEGITIPFALAAGLYFAGFAANEIVQYAMLLALFSGSILAIGSYLSNIAEQKTFIKSGSDHHEHIESEDFYTSIGLPASMSAAALQDATEEQQDWDNFLEKYELEQYAVNYAAALKSSVSVWLGYIIGTVSILIPYMLKLNPVLLYSGLIALVFLWLSGMWRAKYTGYSIITEAGSAVILAAVATLAARLLVNLF